MSVRERILTIRLMEKVSVNPTYAQELGIAARTRPAEPKRQSALNSVIDKS